MHASPLGSLRKRVSRIAAIFATTFSAGLFALGLISAVYEVIQINEPAAEIAQRTRAVESQELKVRELEAAQRLQAFAERARPKQAKPQATAQPPRPPAAASVNGAPAAP